MGTVRKPTGGSGADPTDVAPLESTSALTAETRVAAPRKRPVKRPARRPARKSPGAKAKPKGRTGAKGRGKR